MLTMKLEGLQELERTLREFGPKVAKNGLRVTNFAAAKVYYDAVQDTAPVRSGFLKSQIITVKRRAPAETEVRHSVTVRNKPKVTLVARRGDTAKNRKKGAVGKYHAIAGPKTYGRFIEYGTSRMSAAPFMRPAFEKNAGAAVEAAQKRMEKAVRLAAKKAT